MSLPHSSVTLRALQGRPLLDPVVKDIVVATAHAIAERNGVVLAGLGVTDDSITLEIEGHRLMALGFAMELRRLTTAWYTKKYGEPTLWGEAPEEDELPEWEL